MPVTAMHSLIRALLLQLPEDPSAAIITVKSESVPAVVVNGQGKRHADGPVYDAAVVYVLELCTVLTLRDDETVKTLGGDVAEALQNVIRDAKSYHNTMISRTVFYLLILLKASYVSI
jgi:brefeldin A-resistance guanine nucleotide exchange factor 1